MDKSEGTKYEKFKEMLIKTIEAHFTESLTQEKRSRENDFNYTFVMHIIANNLLQGLLEIAKHYKNDDWVDFNIDLLIKYHINGISILFN